MEEAILVKNIYKSYGNLKAVNNLSFKVHAGEYYAFLGVNGAGKSTTISMICGNLNIDSGNIYIYGNDVKMSSELIKREIGIVFQDSVLDKCLTVYQNLKYRAGLYDITSKDFNEVYERLETLFDLSEIKNKEISKLSGGQKRRVDIARALINNPKILILDEPTTGLDPGSRKMIWNIIKKLRKEYNMTIFLTTHYMEEAADADYITIIDKGKIIAEGTPHDLKTKYAKDTIIIYNVDEDDIIALNVPYTKHKKTYEIEINNTEEATSLIVKNPHLFKDYEVIKGRMDDVFLNATGFELGEE